MAERTPRAAHRAAMTARIKGLALEQLAAVGAGELSLRAIARELGMVSSAIYRYYASRDDLLTALIVDAYGDLADALESRPTTVGDRARAMRDWARAEPHRFALIYGSVIPGYAAPPETIAPAERVVLAFAEPVRSAAASPSEPLSGALAGQAARMGGVTGLEPAVAVGLTTALATLVGFLSLELGGHFVGTFDPADALFDAIVADLENGLAVRST